MNLKNKSVGYYLLIAAAALSIVGAVFYLTAEVTIIPVVVIAIISAVLAIAVAALAAAKPGLKLANLAATACAILLTIALVQSVNSQLDPLGWWVSGLYTLGQVLGFLVFAGLSVLAIILYLIASFNNLEK